MTPADALQADPSRDLSSACFARTGAQTRRILEAALLGLPPNVDDATHLLGVQGADLHALCAVADQLRATTVGDQVTFVACRNLQFTNICYVGCTFCAFAHHADAPEAYRMPIESIVTKAEEAAAAGCTEVCMQGGLHPDMMLDDYVTMVGEIKRRLPTMHVHAFSPFEIQYMARRSKVTEEDALRALRDAGLGSLPGTAAEILDTDVRRVLTRNKLSAEAWVRIIKTAHHLGLFTTSTMMYGHVDTPTHWARHMDLLRQIQRETGGFTEFVPLGFIHDNTRLYASGIARPGPSALDELRVHAVARLMLGNDIRNIQVSWVKMGVRQAQMCLHSGANDFGGTLMNESISQAAGSKHGQAMEAQDLVRHIHELGRDAAQRSTSYQILERFPLPSQAQAR